MFFVLYKPWVDKEIKGKNEIFKGSLAACKAVRFLDEERTQAYMLARSDLVKTLRIKRKVYF